MHFRLQTAGGAALALIFGLGGVGLARQANLAQTAAPASAELSPFKPGEKLTYAVTWSVFPAGEVTSEVDKSGDGPDSALEINAAARSSGAVSLLYNIDNAYHAAVDPKTLCSRQITKTINEGRRHKQTHIVFDEHTREAVLDERDMGKANHPLKHTENAIPACVEDIVTAFYYLRRQPMQVGDKISVPVNDGSKTHVVIIDVQAREQIKTPLGVRTAFRLEPRALGDLYKKKGRMLIWISDDSQRLPLRIKAMMLIGTITGSLQSVTYVHPSATP